MRSYIYMNKTILNVIFLSIQLEFMRVLIFIYLVFSKRIRKHFIAHDGHISSQTEFSLQLNLKFISSFLIQLGESRAVLLVIYINSGSIFIVKEIEFIQNVQNFLLWKSDKN